MSTSQLQKQLVKKHSLTVFRGPLREKQSLIRSPKQSSVPCFKNEYTESELYQRANQKLLPSKISYIEKKPLFNLFIEELILF